MRIKQEIEWHRAGVVVCLDYQMETLRFYFGAEIEIQAVVTERLAEYLRQEV